VAVRRWTKIYVAKLQKQLGNPEESVCTQLEAVTRGLVKTKLTEKTKCVL
jgi:hypothetical protein